MSMRHEPTGACKPGGQQGEVANVNQRGAAHVKKEAGEGEGMQT